MNNTNQLVECSLEAQILAKRHIPARPFIRGCGGFFYVYRNAVRLVITRFDDALVVLRKTDLN
jgi:hypothetical protein